MADEKKTAAKDKQDKTAKKTSGKKKHNPFKSMMSFFKSVKSEGKKVIWAARKDVLKNTLTVLVVVAISAVCIFGVDELLSTGLKATKKAAETTTSETTTVAETSSALAESTTAASTTAAK